MIPMAKVREKMNSEEVVSELDKKYDAKYYQQKTKEEKNLKNN